MDQTPVIVVQGGPAPNGYYFPGGQPQPQLQGQFQPQPMLQTVAPVSSIVYVQQPAAAPSDAEKYGRLGRQLNRRVTKVMGDLLIVCGFLALIGDILETTAFAIELSGSRVPLSYSYIYYAGYWCGSLIVASGSVATHSSKHPSNCMVIADVVAAGVGGVFAIVLLALSADKMSIIVDAYNRCGRGCSFFTQMMLAAYSVMIAGSSLALVFAGILAVFCVIALVKGICGGNDVQAA